MQRKELPQPADDSLEMDEPEADKEASDDESDDEGEDRDPRDAAAAALPLKRLDNDDGTDPTEVAEPGTTLVDREPPGMRALEICVSTAEPEPAGAGKFDCCAGGAADTDATTGTARGAWRRPVAAVAA